jgi:hypothetical protein
MTTIKLEGILGTEGPTWYRNYARFKNEVTCTALRKTLDILGARYMVMGHTVVDQIKVMCDRAILIDTGNSWAVRNHPSALEILQKDGITIRMRALYQDRNDTLIDFTGVKFP